MGDEQRFSEKWDFRRQDNNFDDSSSDDPDSNSTRDPLIHSPNLVIYSNQIDNGTKTLTREQPAETRKRRCKKDESKPEKAKQVRKRKPKIVCAEENKKKEEIVMEKDEVGMFMKTLLDDLTASRKSLMDWMKTELCGPDQVFASPLPVKNIPVAAVSVRKRMPKKKKGEEANKETEKQSKPDQNDPEMNKPKEKSPEITQNDGDQLQELDCNSGPLDRFLKSGQGGLGRNYFQQQQDEEGIVTQNEIGNEQTAVMTNQKSVVLAIKAPNLSQRQKRTREAKTIKNRLSVVERTGSETQRGHNFVVPIAPKLSSPPSLSPIFPEGSSLNSFFPSSSEGITCLASNNNFQVIQPPVASQIPDLSEFQTGRQRFGSCLFSNNGYFSGFPAALQPNFPAQVNPMTPSQHRENNNMFGAIRFPEYQLENSLSDYRTSSGL